MNAQNIHKVFFLLSVIGLLSRENVEPWPDDWSMILDVKNFDGEEKSCIMFTSPDGRIGVTNYHCMRTEMECNGAKERHGRFKCAKVLRMWPDDEVTVFLLSNVWPGSYPAISIGEKSHTPFSINFMKRSSAVVSGGGSCIMKNANHFGIKDRLMDSYQNPKWYKYNLADQCTAETDSGDSGGPILDAKKERIIGIAFARVSMGPPGILWKPFRPEVAAAINGDEQIFLNPIFGW